MTVTGKKLEGTGWVYRYSGAPDFLYTVGFWRGDIWQPESDHNSPEEAAKRIHYLNGGDDATLLEQRDKLVEALRKLHSCALGYHDSTEEANNATMKHFGDALAEAERVLREVGE